jgi:hypothetical protein
MYLIQRSDFDDITKNLLEHAAEAAFRNIVRQHPRQARNAKLLAAVQSAVVQSASLNTRDYHQLVTYAESLGLTFLMAETSPIAEAYA